MGPCLCGVFRCRRTCVFCRIQNDAGVCMGSDQAPLGERGAAFDHGAHKQSAVRKPIAFYAEQRTGGYDFACDRVGDSCFDSTKRSVKTRPATITPSTADTWVKLRPVNCVA